MARTFQEWVHWLELGKGAALIRWTAVALAVVLLSAWISYKQFHGPTSETTLAQAVVARQIAEGNGYSTLVNYPQTAARLQKMGTGWKEAHFPELHHAPLYPALLGVVFSTLPEWLREYCFNTPPEPPAGFLADYVLLVINLALLWCAAIQLFVLGRRLFEPAVGVVSALGLLLSAGVWHEAVAVNGSTLAMVLCLGLVQLCVRVENASARGTLPTFWLGLAGLQCGLVFLLDYSAGLIVVPVIAYAWLRFAGERWLATVPVALGFLLVAGAWCSWNAAQTGTVVGLAWQEVAMRNDGSLSDPEHVRGTLLETVPALSLAKFANKGLTGLQASLSEKVWSGGAMFFTAFFVAGFLYHFRQPRVNTLRLLVASVFIVLVIAHAFLTSGESERHPAVYLAPLLILFGAGFCSVLAASSERFSAHVRWVLGVVLGLQAIPLLQDALEPRQLHFHYPPYYPGLFLGMKNEMYRRGGENPPWMADVPAGAAWYSGQRVWAQPATLRDFYMIGAEQPMLALVLTPETLDRPFFSELGHRTETLRIGEWADIYSGLATGRLPASFPLSLPQKVSDNLYVLIDPLAQPIRRQ